MNRSGKHPGVAPLLFLVALIALLVPGFAAATEQTGTVQGTVADDEGSPLTGAVVTLQSDEMQGVRSFTTKGDGSFWMPGLPPGLYELRAEFSGLQTYVQTGIRVTIGSEVRVDVVLTTAEVTDVVTVVDDKPTVDTADSGQGAVVTKEYLEALPNRRSYQSAVQFAPGVTGGANPNVKGGSSSENVWLLDGANTTDPVTGTFSFNFNLDAIEEIEVITGGFKAENGGTLGSIINVRTESGGNELHGSIRGFYSNGNWSPKRDAIYTPDGRQLEGSEFDRDSQNFDLNVSVGGAIVQDKLWFFSSLKYIHNVGTSAGARSPRVFDGFNLFTKLTARPHPRHEVILSALGSVANISNQIQSFRYDPDAQRHQHQSNFTLGAEWNWRITDSIIANVHYTRFKSAIDVTPQPCTWRDDLRFKQCKEGQSEGYIDFLTPATLGASGARYEDNYWRFSLNDRWRDSVRASVTGFVRRALGTHKIKGGVEFGWTRSQVQFGVPGNLRLTQGLDDSGDPTSVEPFWWVEYDGQISQANNGNSIFGFLQDTWQPAPWLTVDLGVKYDRVVLNNDVGERIVGFNAFTPVGGVSVDPSGRKMAKIYLGGGINIDQGKLLVSGFLDKNGTGSKLYVEERYGGSEVNTSFSQWNYSRGQSNYNSHDKLTAPRVYGLVTGFEMNIGAKTKVGLEGTAKWFRNLWEDDEVNYIWNGAGTNTIGVINGLQDYFFRLRTPNQASRNYYSLSFILQRQMFKGLLLDINYTMSMTRGLTETQITGALDNPTQQPFEYGWLGSDRPHVIKASAAYLTPFGLQVAGTFRFQSGSRFDRTYYSDKSGGYAVYVAEVGTFDSVNPFWSVDLRAIYKLKMPYGRLFFQVDLYNVTNNRQATGISTATLNSRGEYNASGRQGPMDLQLGIGYEF
ncbi:MAG: TonB-dependent receptor [Deltaproteobacteria bacterium]|nr:TonB-dependent receptor [Deltaproteobacteria bacterium]